MQGVSGPEEEREIGCGCCSAQALVMLGCSSIRGSKEERFGCDLPVESFTRRGLQPFRCQGNCLYLLCLSTSVFSGMLVSRHSSLLMQACSSPLPCNTGYTRARTRMRAHTLSPTLTNRTQ